MADINLIACLYPHGHGAAFRNAALAVDMAANASLRVDPLIEDRSQQSSGAPDGNRDSDGDDVEDSSVYGPDAGLQLRFDAWRKNRVGFVFGTSPRSDIVLPKKDSLLGVAPQKCALTFDAQGRLILRDLQDSRRKKGGTAVVYKAQGGQKRRNFTWILSGTRFTLRNNPSVIALHDNLQFQLVVAQHDLSSIQYRENVAQFSSRATADVDDLSFGGFGFQSLSSSAAPSVAQTPSTNAVLLRSGELGRGAQAVVFCVWDVSTGHEFASKEPTTQAVHRRLRGEVQLLSRLNHEHIVQCLPWLSTTTPIPRLVLEYLPHGSLGDQDELEAISTEEVFDILCQSLSALRYLHERDNPIVHRDIKPSNILVHSRMPLHIKLSDFGYSKESEDYLRTGCGTPLYVAPEIFKRKSYDASVDIWSLGVVVYQYAQGLPCLDVEGVFNGSRWTKSIIQKLEAEVQESHCPLLTFLKTAMLVKDREERYSAHRCSKETPRLDVSQFRCSPETPYETTGLYGPVDTPELATEVNLASDLPATEPGTELDRVGRSNAPSPESHAYASAGRARRAMTSRVSKVKSPSSDKDKGKAKRRFPQSKSSAPADETAYFYNRFSNPLHPLYAGSSLGVAEGSNSKYELTEESAQSGPTAAPAGDAVPGQSSSSVLTQWYYEPGWAEPAPQNGCDASAVVYERVRYLGAQMQDWQGHEEEPG